MRNPKNYTTSMKSVRSFFWAPPQEEVVTLDDVLIYLGEFGRYQKYLFWMLMIFSLYLTFLYFSQAFITVLPTEYWCKLPLIEGISPERVKELVIPSSKVVPYEGHELAYSRCWMYDVPTTTIITATQSDDNWPMKKCDSWEFKLSAANVPYMSVAAEQEWVCDEAYKVPLAYCIFFVGSIVGGLVFGTMADKYGRVPVLVATNMIGFLGGISTICVSEFWHFCACRFVVGLAYDTCFVIAYILVLEYVGPKWRTFAANMSYGLFYTLGAVSIPWMAYGIADWKTFIVATSVPLALVVVTPFVIPESIRWLISNGKIEKATRILLRIERTNRITLPDDVYDSFLRDCSKTAEAFASETHTILDLFRTKRLRRITLLLTLAWCVIQMSYEGHIRCLDNLGMNVFTTFTIASATELPAEVFIICTLDVLGRRWVLFASVIISGLFSLFAASFPLGTVYASLAFCSRFFINIASSVAMQFAAELLPTVVRGEGVALIHVTGYVTSLFSPIIAFSSRVMHNLPMIILGLSCVFAGVLSLFLPETLMEQLPQTLMDGELFGIDQNFWDMPCARKKPVDMRRHYTHAVRPVSRPSILRSSIISGRKGIEKRHDVIKKRARQLTPAATRSGTSTTA